MTRDQLCLSHWSIDNELRTAYFLVFNYLSFFLIFLYFFCRLFEDRFFWRFRIHYFLSELILHKFLAFQTHAKWPRKKAKRASSHPGFILCLHASAINRLGCFLFFSWFIWKLLLVGHPPINLFISSAAVLISIEDVPNRILSEPSVPTHPPDSHVVDEAFVDDIYSLSVRDPVIVVFVVWLDFFHS